MLNRKLDIVHLSQFVVIMILVIAANFVFVRQILFQKVEQNLELSTQSFYNQNIREIQQISNVLEIINSSKNYYDYDKNPLIKYSLEHSNLFNYVNIYDQTDSVYQAVYSYVSEDFKGNIDDDISLKKLQHSKQNRIFDLNVPSDSLHTSIKYLEKLKSNEIISIYYSNEKLDAFIQSLSNISEGVAIIFNRSDNKIIYHSDLENEKYSELQNDLAKINGKAQKAGIASNNTIVLKNIKLTGHHGSYLVNVIYEPRLDWYYVIGEPYLKIYASIYSYFKKSSLVLLIVVLLMAWLIVRSNAKQLKPIKEAIERLSNNEFVKINNQNYKDEVSLIMHSFDMLKKQIYRYKQSYEDAMEVSSQRERDLALAKQLQKNILPSPNPSFKVATNIDIDIYSKALYGVGGDLYDYFLIDKNRILFSIGDVSGKGISSALYMTFVHTLLRAIANPHLSCSELLENLNNKLLDDNISDLFVTMFVGIMNFNTGEMEYTNAAHTHPMVVEKSGNIYALEQNHGIPIGIYKNKQYKSSTIHLKKDDSLFLFTDGLTDAADENGMKYSASVLKYNLMGSWFLSSEEIVNKIKDSVTDFKGNVGQEDDLTLMCVKYS